MRYKIKATGEILVKGDNLTIGAIGNQQGHIYHSVETGFLYAFTYDEAFLFLESLPLGDCPIDVYAIAHQFVPKQQAVKISDLVEAAILKILADRPKPS
jgi:hypothetical protein